MPSATEIVLAAFSIKPRMCIHVLMETTGLREEILMYALHRLREDSSVKMEAGIYSRKNEAFVPSYLGLDAQHLPALFGLDENEARARLVMLKRMKDRLISEWHPILDKLIGDYERGLKSVEGIRYGAEDDLAGVAKTGV